MDKRQLLSTDIFKGMTEKELAIALTSLNARVKTYNSDEIILMAGDKIRQFGMVLSGAVNVETINFLGERQIINHISKGDIFGETYAYAGEKPIPVEVVAVKDSKILFLNGRATTNYYADSNSEYSLESWEVKFNSNLLENSMGKCMALSARIFHTGPKSVRGRVSAYLNSQMVMKGKKEFKIPFNRQQMADYLNLDRTALSKELGKMRKEGIIEFKKNHFRILDLDNF